MKYSLHLTGAKELQVFNRQEFRTDSIQTHILFFFHPVNKHQPFSRPDPPQPHIAASTTGHGLPLHTYITSGVLSSNPNEESREEVDSGWLHSTTETPQVITMSSPLFHVRLPLYSKLIWVERIQRPTSQTCWAFGSCKALPKHLGIAVCMSTFAFCGT